MGFDSDYDEVHSPSWFNLAPEAEGFIDIEFPLSCQGCENVLLQPDGLCSVPAVARLLPAGDKSQLQLRPGISLSKWKSSAETYKELQQKVRQHT